MSQRSGGFLAAPLASFRPQIFNKVKYVQRDKNILFFTLLWPSEKGGY